MSSATAIDEDTIRPSDSTDLLSRLYVQLQDLLLIHYEHSLLKSENDSPQELGSLFLTKLQYVYGEKSAAKSCMRFNVTLDPDKAGSVAAVALTLELSVRNRKCSVQS